MHIIKWVIFIELYRRNSVLKKYLVILGIPIICMLGTIQHFLYRASNNNFLVGLLCPINESVWEHLKMIYFPILIYWLATFFALRNKEDIDLIIYLKALTYTIIIAMLLMLFLYYTYKGIIGKNILIVDVIIYIVAICISQMLGIHFINIINRDKWSYVVFILVVFLFCFILFQLKTPNLPFFHNTFFHLY